jgi:hypothetical protein
MQRYIPLHPTPLPSSSPLPSPFPHSSAFPTFDQKKRLKNEPERKGHRKSKLSRRGPGEGLEQGTREKRAKEKEQERIKS